MDVILCLPLCFDIQFSVIGNYVFFLGVMTEKEFEEDVEQC